jgi:S1-C subfamily serine protease
VSGVAVVLVALVLYGQLAPRTAPLTTEDVDQRVASVLSSQVPPPPFSAIAFAAVAPSLVLIESHIGPSAFETDPPDPLGPPDPFGTTEPTGPEPGETQGELGTGVVVTADGSILTALHVVQDADAITLTFMDGSTSAAWVAEEDPAKDIALIMADALPPDVLPATLGNPRLPVGSEAYVVGNPYGLFGSLSAGVISGRGRSFQQPGTDITITDLIQIDAAVNPGNSGGPLLNRVGHVVGIVIALINPTRDETFIGIGLAVPIDTAATGAGDMPPY